MFIAGPDMRVGFRKSGASGPFNGHATLGTGLTAYWRLNEASGPRADVLAGNDLTDTNTVTSTSKGAGAPANMPDTVAEFTSGNSEDLRRNAQTAFQNAGKRSVSFWFKTSDVTQVKGIMGVGATVQTGTPQWFFRLNGSHLSLYASVDGIGTYNYTDGATGLSNDTWYHAGVSYAHPGWVVYLNGAAQITDNDGIDGSQSSANLFFGAAFPGYLTMNLSSVGAWSRDLSAAEFSALYAGGAALVY